MPDYPATQLKDDSSRWIGAVSADPLGAGKLKVTHFGQLRQLTEGKLPHFAQLRREGAYGPLATIQPILSPVVWTTIATGRAPQDHGVLDFVEIGADGKATPITSLRRRVPALWNGNRQVLGLQAGDAARRRATRG